MSEETIIVESGETTDDSRRENTEISEEELWDTFQDPPSKKKAGPSDEKIELFNSMVKKIKIVVCVLVFIMILGTSVLSKISLLFMTSHITKDRKIPLCIKTSESVAVFDDINGDELIIATISDKQRIAWIWAIIFAYIVPELISFLRAARMCFFKKIKRPNMIEFIIVFCVETLHVIGMAVFMMLVLPGLDVIKGVMLTNCVCFVPALLSLFSDWHRRNGDEKRSLSKIMPFHVLAICAQLSGLIFWPLFNDDPYMWLIPLALFFISFNWWENFVSDKSRFPFIVYMDKVKKSLANTKYAIYVYTSLWKIIVFLLVSLWLSSLSIPDINFEMFFTEFSSEWTNHIIIANRTGTMVPEKLTSTVICWTLFTQVVSSYACYVLTKFACKIRIQSFSFGLPINLTVPVSVSILLILCAIRKYNVCAFYGSFPDYLFWNTPNLDSGAYAISIIWILSQAWITRHIWLPKSNKNAPTDNLFVTPLYNGLIIDQSLSLNRRRKDITENEDDADDHAEDKIPHIFICATMWHETREEMMEFLKSVLRLDEDQSARWLARKYIQTDLDYIDPEYYHLEIHIFFDDAFIIDKNNKNDTESNPINEYVKTLITSISDAARAVHRTEMKIRAPQKYVTPYGGRLEWILPGKTKLIAHLKQADKIRKKKRWSQVMYMYYLLGYRIMQSDKSKERKDVISKKTFLLALDGDIGFQPNAVHLLMNRMKLDKHLAAACGRIHPIGDGPMVWYQKFEYSVGHWLQKSTEHIIGCVLCSPGCFSLFRGSALMDNSVMRKYTTNSEEALHFVQYDQGEDRWLCTLLLKQGYRVEYIAASDAYANSPEGFHEFYNQRRRWVPATMANILDLLMDANEIVKHNDSISILYIAYQSMLMVGTVLGPGTIFLMMIGALVAVFNIGLWVAFIFNFIPLLVFMILCLWFKQKYQLKYAVGLTAAYALVMMAVLIGLIIQIINGGATSPTALFFFAVTAQIIIAGILHPLEVSYLIHGIIYYITIPSMYMLLVIYSIFNMNDVSWGTRETLKPVEVDAPVAEKQGLFEKYFTKGWKEKESAMCKILSEVHDQLTQVTMKLNETNNHIRNIDNDVKIVSSNIPRKSSIVPPTITNDINIEEEEEEEVEETINIPRDWLCDPDLIDGELKTLNEAEQKFWHAMIERYLKPLDLDTKLLNNNKKILKSLRDKAVFAFIMFNAIFVLVIFMLQMNNDILYIKWPLGNHRLEPIGFLFVIFFGVILFIQFIAMLMHRYSTISQILAATDLDYHCVKKPHEKLPEIDIRDNAVTIARKVQKPMVEWDEGKLDSEQRIIAARRQTIYKIFNQQEKKKQDFSDLERNFKTRYLNPKPLNLDNLNLEPKTIERLEMHRRDTIAQFTSSETNGIASNTERILENNSQTLPANARTQTSYAPQKMDEASSPRHGENCNGDSNMC